MYVMLFSITSPTAVQRSPRHTNEPRLARVLRGVVLLFPSFFLYVSSLSPGGEHIVCLYERYDWNNPPSCSRRSCLLAPTTYYLLLSRKGEQHLLR